MTRITLDSPLALLACLALPAACDAEPDPELQPLLADEAAFSPEEGEEDPGFESLGDDSGGEAEPDAAPADDPDDPGPPAIFSWTPPPSASGDAGAFRIEADDWDTVYLAPFDDYFCALAGVQGDFDSNSVHFAEVSEAYGWWRLRAGDGVTTAAECVPRSSFDTMDNLLRQIFGLPLQPTAHWASASFATTAYVGPSCSDAQADTWWGDAVPVLELVSGKFQGHGEYAAVEPGPAWNLPGRVRAQTCEYGSSSFPNVGVVAGARSFYVGEVGAQPYPAVYYGVSPSGAGQLGEYEHIPEGVLRPPGTGSLALAPADKAFCFLTKVSGRLDALNKGVWIDRGPDGSTWTLHVSGTSWSVEGRARCMSYVQGIDLSDGPMNWY